MNDEKDTETTQAGDTNAGVKPGSEPAPAAEPEPAAEPVAAEPPAEPADESQGELI